MLVAAIVKGGKDAADVVICEVYARRPPDYAVYSTNERVLVHFSDLRDLEQTQRSALAQLNPLRGEINGLVDGWRTSSDPKLQAKARRYDRRVGDALTVGLEQDVASAAQLLTEIKKDIIDERTSWARFFYLIVASIAVAVAILIFSVLSIPCLGLPPASYDLLFAAAIGAVGAFFSIAIGIRNRTILTDLRTRDNSLDAVLRVVIGSIAATLLVCFVLSGAVTLTIGSANLAHDPAWLYLLIVAFIGGFSERMVPDLLAKAAADPASVTTPRSPSSVAANAPAQKPTSVVAAAAAVGVMAAGPDEDQDHCLCNLAMQPAEATPDTELPAATGGVAVPR